ncbi:hypothetical protein GF362_03895 [Candidatus Dojkabacteria bacterium]|nr:hypothetical protein [Candidatus Dojkabacteria bacterium]
MCGRFVLDIDNQFYPRFRIKEAVYGIKPRFNIAPSQEVPVITNNNGKNELVIMQWGLVPFWAKDSSIGSKMINARSETIDEKPSFKKAFRSQRCLVPATGFYEWKTEGGKKIPHYVHLKKEKYFAMAGIYDRWKGHDDESITTFTIITTEPNEIVAKLHHRMPAVLEKEDEQTWLQEEDGPKLKKLLTPFRGNMEEYAVTTDVNNPENDTRGLTEPTQQTLFS